MSRWGLVIILVANAMLLFEVARNRWGGPQATMELTERDLPVSQKGEDSTALFLRLLWEREGFDGRRQNAPPQATFVVLERRDLLTVVEAGREFAALRKRYPDGSRFAILPGLIRSRSITIYPREICVPPAWRGVFSAAHYTVTLAFGNWQEPWIVDARRRP